MVQPWIIYTFSMNWWGRSGLIAAGSFFIFTGVMQMRAGHFVFVNASYYQTTFAASATGAGIVLVLFAFLPSGDWLYRRISTRRFLHREPGEGAAGARRKFRRSHNIAL